MANDIFGGVFDGLRGFSESIGDMFSRGDSISPRTVGAKEEAELIASGWASSSGSKRDSIFKAGADVAKNLANTFSSGVSSNEMPVTSGMYNGRSSYGNTRTSSVSSVDPGDFERMWISRASKFSSYESVASKGTTKVKTKTDTDL